METNLYTVLHDCNKYRLSKRGSTHAHIYGGWVTPLGLTTEDLYFLLPGLPLLLLLANIDFHNSVSISPQLLCKSDLSCVIASLLSVIMSEKNKFVLLTNLYILTSHYY